MAGCESNTPVEALSEQGELTATELLGQSPVVVDSLGTEERQQFKSGPIFPPVITENLRKMLEEQGINPDSLTWPESPAKGNWLVGRQVWEKYLENQKIDSDSLFGEAVHRSAKPHLEFDVTPLAENMATPASTEFIVTDGHGSPSSGSITIQYEGEQVTTSYTSSDNTFSVASMISHKINDDADIQLTSIVSGAEVTVTEKRPGCEFNGNLVHISFSTGTHIAVNDSDVHLEGGTDDGVGCFPPDMLSTPVLVAPSNGAADQPVDNLMLDWSLVEDAATYQLQVATDAGFNELVINESGITSTFATVSGLAFSTTYYWRVKAFNGAIESDWSLTWSFTTTGAPPAIQIAWHSHITTPHFQDFGLVVMESVSMASQPIQFISVTGTSRRDHMIIAQLSDGGNNQNGAGVLWPETKQAHEPESFWEQMGNHLFQDPGLNNGSPVFTGSSDHVHF